MDEPGVEAGLTGAEAVMLWFGSWPSFHDAEIISLTLARKGQSVLSVYPYYPINPAVVDFIFETVTDIDLQDFSGQNVISCLGVGMATDQNGNKVFRVVLGACYGLAGRIDATSLASNYHLARVRMASAYGKSGPWSGVCEASDCGQPRAAVPTSGL
jgi:hypothetical protein